MPKRFQIYEIFELKNSGLLEQMIFQHFAENRINRKREFLKIHPERVCDFINDNKRIKAENDTIIAGKLAKLGVERGEMLRFKEGNDVYQNISAKVIDEGNTMDILYKGKKMSLSNSAQKILSDKFDKKWSSAQGTIFWTYKGKTIRELMDQND